MPFDTFGIPEYFCDSVCAIEDAGHGMIRVIRGIRRKGGEVQPVVSIVLPAATLMETGAQIRGFAATMDGKPVASSSNH